MSKEKIIALANRVLSAGFFFLTIVVPFILTPLNYELFEYNKMMVVYAVTVVVACAWLAKMLAQGKVTIAKTALDIPLLLFLGSQALSTIFSIDPHVSWLGYYSRFNGGLWSTISYLILYYAFLTNWEGQERLVRLLKTTLAIATAVALYAFFEHFGYSLSCLIFTGKLGITCWVQDVQNRVFATLGQPNWLAAYLVALAPLAMAFALTELIKSKHEARNPKQSLPFNKFAFFRISNLDFWIWAVVSLLSFIVTLYTRSRSGLVGFAVAEIIFWGLVFLRTQDKKLWLLPFLALNLFFAASLFINGTHVDTIDKYFSLEGWKSRWSKSVQKAQPVVQPPQTGTLLEIGGTASSTIRKYVWEAALTAWASSTKTKLIGTGTETFAFAFYQFKPKAHNLTTEWDFLYNKAHNEYLNYLATTGLLGLGSYLFFIGMFIWWFVKFSILNFKLKIENPKEQTVLATALFSGWVSILVTNFFGFSVVVTQLFLFLFPAFTFVTTQPNLTMRSLPLNLREGWIKTAYFLIGLIALYFLFTLSKFWYADTLFATGYRLDRAGQFAAAEKSLASAVALNRAEPLYHDEFSQSLAGVASQLVDEKQASQAATFMKESISENDLALSISPKNVNFWKTRTKILYSFASFLPQMNAEAITSLEEALKLSPTDPKIYYNLAILYGRQNENDKAIDELKKAIVVRPNYRDAYYALYVFYTEVKKPDLARQTLEDYLAKVDPNDKDFLQRLGR